MMELYIEGISHNGEGVARTDEGKVVFIPYTIPEEMVTAEIIEEKKQYSRGIVREIITASPFRVKPECPYYYQCGGCSYQHVEYKHQLYLKQRIVNDTLKRIGGIYSEAKFIIGMKTPWNYRNKVAWHLTRAGNTRKMGFYCFRSNELVDIEQCPLLLPELNKASLLIRKMLPEIEIGEKSSIMLRHANQHAETMVQFIDCQPEESVLKELSKAIQSIYICQKGKSKLLSGKGEISQKTGENTFALGPEDFFQVNPEQSDKLVNMVQHYLGLSSNAKVLDAYCGVGMFALNIAKDADLVIGVDSNPSAIRNAKKNAILNGLQNCQFITGSCEKIITDLKIRFTHIIIDPPRAGLKMKFINKILSIAPELIVYISCNPATLARDIKRFTTNNYTLTKVQPLDMFPQTHSIENIVLLQKSIKD
ncbi:MAG TPA: 23S rRNA (uracil(1939)-C(5))-methyltransferase RlmD [Atribacterota bacterium]|nr:23S rRNA (uracil(1939)-C(5))-methyltransferase RlmD [Atribacterota bacterium]